MIIFSGDLHRLSNYFWAVLPFCVVQLFGLVLLFEDVIVGDSPSAVVHVKQPCRDALGGRPVPTAAVPLFMITLISKVFIYYHCVLQGA